MLTNIMIIIFLISVLALAIKATLDKKLLRYIVSFITSLGMTLLIGREIDMYITTYVLETSAFILSIVLIIGLTVVFTYSKESMKTLILALVVIIVVSTIQILRM